MTELSTTNKVPWLAFQLDDAFVQRYAGARPPFGGGLGEIVFWRTYSRSDNPRLHGMERWVDVCRRVIEGMFSIEREHCEESGRPLDEERVRADAREAFDRMFRLHWSPPGRGLALLGTPLVHERHEVAALQSCAFVSTAHIATEGAEPFRWLMQQSLLGVGVGFDTRGAGTVIIRSPHPADDREPLRIGDTREGWSQSVRQLIDSYLGPGRPATRFCYDAIRPYGAPIRGFGGRASGPEALRELHTTIRRLLDRHVGWPIDSRLIVDLMNVCGRCVLAGHVRRAAEIALGCPEDATFVRLKDPAVNPERNGAFYDPVQETGERGWGWVSNNTVFARCGQDYGALARQSWERGEPGYLWLDNVRGYERMNGVADTRDVRAAGINPCGEQPLEDREICTLSEILLPNLDSPEEARRAAVCAHRYAKIVTLAATWWPEGSRTRAIALRNRRVGVSVTGVTQALDRLGEPALIERLEDMYATIREADAALSERYAVPQSVRLTSVKPSGTLSTLAGVTPGAHFAVAGRYFLRRIALPAAGRLAARLRVHGYLVEPSHTAPDTVIAAVPHDLGPHARAVEQTSLEEQARVAEILARHWSGNAVSVTLTFDKGDTSPADLEALLERIQTRLKTVSFLPRDGHGYRQAPYEALTRDAYERQVERIVPFHIEGNPSDLHEADDLYCGGLRCESVPTGGAKDGLPGPSRAYPRSPARLDGDLGAAREDVLLIAPAMRAAQSRGRVHDESTAPYLGTYEQDRIRITQAAAFRRLEDKTQVFLSRNGQAYRTRLTHTLEVAQVARTAARRLGLNEDLTEAIALSHDLGHGPFGHKGEVVLRDLMAEHGGFEHNAHGLRIVDLLERRHPRWPGLNLTYEVREAFALHSPQDTAALGFAARVHPLLEAQLVDCCDSIAYLSHDIDDSIAAGLVTLERMQEIPIWREAWASARSHEPDLTPRLGVLAAARHLIRVALDDLVKATRDRLVAGAVATPEEVQVHANLLVGFSPGMARARSELMEFLHEYCYRHPTQVELGHEARRILTGLFASYSDDASRLGPEAEAALERFGVERTVCDRIAAMADREAVEAHARLGA